MPGRCPSSVTCGDALRGEDVAQCPKSLRCIMISIHVHREEDDRVRPAQLLRQLPISIHVLREKDDNDHIGIAPSRQ